MSIIATGTPILTYQWYKGAVGTETNPVSGQTESNFAVTLSDVGVETFWCKVSNACGDENSEQFTITVKVNPATLPSGAGTFGGRTCFDIALSNDNDNNCGMLSGRTSQQADFNQTSINTQTYTFTPSGTVSKVRFAYVESQPGVIVQSLTPTNSGYETQTNITGACTVVLVYKTSLNDDALGLTNNEPLTVDIYAIYNDNATGTGTDKAIKLTSIIKDCACCGAATATGWLSFMCHNLGADESLDPFTWNNSKGSLNGFDIKGDLFQWGRTDDGHGKRNSPTETIPATSTTPTHGRFFKLSGGVDDWYFYSGANNRWGDGTQSENMPRGYNDPCPAGWKIPSQKQWQAIMNNNNWEWTGNGYKIGQNLYLPAAGSRSPDAIVGFVGDTGVYWSSTVPGDNGAYTLIFSESFKNTSSYNRTNGYSVRCVQE
jgi:uncharacterized protein (TIGR02145 family)